MCAVIWLTPRIPFPRINCFELRHMSSECDWGTRAVPVLSHDIIQHFLGVAHQFTTLGLEVQASAYSSEDNGVVSYLAFLPQVNTVSEVYDKSSCPSEFHAVQHFAQVTGKPADGFRFRCWIHTHPLFKAYMSSMDLCQMYFLRCENPDSFAIVLSPRKEGVKALCVHLTDDGFSRLDHYKQVAEGDFVQYVKARIGGSTHTFYCQIPFSISTVCNVMTADLRDPDDVISQLSNSISSRRDAAGSTIHFWQ